uniref:Carbonic anhydrase n=1 Tax=Fundulus heteroclitus TaxID=8078 RepID=A0A3Q2U4G2_FUNHE
MKLTENPILASKSYKDDSFVQWGPEGEHHWSKHYPFCGGTFQSPIDIKSELLRFDPALRPIEVQNYNLAPDEQLTLGNNGHSCEYKSAESSINLRHRYTAAQLHFHWGSSSRPAGSEHMVNSRQYAAEMHVVHYNSEKYPNISMAVDKSDGLAVLGVLVGDFNPAYEQFLKFINDHKVQVPGFNVRALLPTRLDEYYRYDGSLTTPPCYPSVLWTVFKNHVTISQKQDSVAIPLHSNFRKPKLIDSRVVLVSFKEGKYNLLCFVIEGKGKKKDIALLLTWLKKQLLVVCKSLPQWLWLMWHHLLLAVFYTKNVKYYLCL